MDAARYAQLIASKACMLVFVLAVQLCLHFFDHSDGAARVLNYYCPELLLVEVKFFDFPQIYIVIIMFIHR